eukprot:SAG11_NODE_1169_length_5616_cov_44.787566_3_plen_51_part_00
MVVFRTAFECPSKLVSGVAFLNHSESMLHFDDILDYVPQKMERSLRGDKI